MRKFNKIIKSIISIAMAFVFIFATGCSNAPVDDNVATIVPRPPVEKTISLKQTSLNINVGDEVQLELDEYDRTSENPIVWTSGDESIIKIETTDIKNLVNVIAMGDGETQITVTQGTATTTCAVNSSFNGMSASIEMSVDQTFNIQKNKSFKLNPKISFAGKTYDDGEFTYALSNETDFAIEDGVLVGMTTGATTDVIINGTWRGKTSSEMPDLQSVWTVEVVDSVNLVIKEYTADYAEVYTTAMFDGKAYANSIDFTPVVYINDEVKEDANISVSISDDKKLAFSDNKLIGKESGEAVVTVTYSDNDKTLSETFTVNVIRPIAHYSKKVEYFSAYSGTLRDPADSYKEKSLIDYLYAGEENVEVIDAFMGDTQLTVENGKILGVTGINTSTFDTVLTIGTKTSTYTVDVTVYGQYVYEAKDLDVFTRTSKNLNFSGYVELARNIDASNYEAGIHFNGEAKGAYPSTSSGIAFTNNTYYSGVFDGKGYTISGLTVNYNANHSSPSANERSAHGMFVALESATIKNMAFTGLNLKGRCLFGFYSNNTNYENIKIEVSSLTKQYYYQGNVMTYYALIGGSVKNMYITVPSTYEIKQATNHTGYFYGAFATVPVGTSVQQPVIENCLVVSKLPLGYHSRWGAQVSISYAATDTSEFIEFINQQWWNRYATHHNTLKKEYQKLDGADPNKADGEILTLIGRAQILQGVYKYNTVADLNADTSISSVISTFTAPCWKIESGVLSWNVK